MIGDGAPFGGTRLAAMHGDALIVYRRDDSPGLPFPGLLDLPGGGREGDEGPETCAVRSLAADFGISVGEDRLHYARAYLLGDGATVSWFLALRLTEAEVEAVRFGDEGQDWALLPMADFMADEDAVPQLRDWLAHYLAADTTIRYLDTTSENPGKA